jgi:hypothetical protein
VTYSEPTIFSRASTFISEKRGKVYIKLFERNQERRWGAPPDLKKRWKFGIRFEGMDRIPNFQ